MMEIRIKFTDEEMTRTKKSDMEAFEFYLSLCEFVEVEEFKNYWKLIVITKDSIAIDGISIVLNTTPIFARKAINMPNLVEYTYILDESTKFIKDIAEAFS